MRAIVTVVGKDRVGIIANVCDLLAKYQVNVLDISQTVLQGYFTMIMMVDATHCELPIAELIKMASSRRWTSTSSGRTSSTPCIGFK